MSAATSAPHPAAAGAASARRDAFAAYLEALSARSDFAQYLHEDATLTIFGGPAASGGAAVAQLIGAIHGDMFDARVRVRRTVCEGDHAAAELDFVGTHTGEFAGVPASGRPVDVPYSAVYDFAADGRILAIRVYMPMQILLAQIAPAA